MYGPFGYYTKGTSFVFPSKLGVINGFYGRAGRGEGYVDAIGIFVKPFEDLSCICSTQGQIITKVNEVLNVDVPREAGPWGGNSGKPFDDGVFAAIKHVYVHVGDGLIHAIQFLYQTKDGSSSIMSKRHGGAGDVDKIYRENSYNWENSITVGPCCNRPEGDHEWSFKPNGGITEIKLRRGVVIDSITFKSIDEKGNAESSNKFGGDGGGNEHVISLNWPKEYLIKLNGTLATYAGFHGIGSLCFETNLKKYGPFGHTDSTPFEFSVKDGVIVGFHGRFGNYINTIGVYIKHSAELFWPSSQPKVRLLLFSPTSFKKKISYIIIK
ncbi:hypothetical protein EZV62_021395 [Acer yangbiense]|uniref:Jacalin-type lectin domain-containing protein n=1 Tax=Acer yangbiense TaxID=1000413 RepID=A0A5C7H7R6_9ROSI|nr:hypothetical protein EZV62_021395 [Acer yangbiense]